MRARTKALALAAIACRTLVLILHVCVLFLAAVSAQDRQDDQKRVALVIGVSQYKHVTPLTNPANDSRDIAAALTRLRFDVVELHDPTLAELKDTQFSFIEKLADADVAILYYAGHSIQVDGANYLIPVDATLSSPRDIDSQMLNIARLVNLMDKLAKTKIIILDACRDNPFLPQVQDVLAKAGDSRSAGQGLANINEPSSYKLAQEEIKTYGSIIAYAAAPGATAADGEGRNSPYTAAFLRHVEKPGLEVGRMFREVAASVIEETDGVQKPEYLVKLTNEFYFLRPEPSLCDKLAVAPFNQVGLQGVEFDSINAKKAVPACEDAVKQQPEHPRFLHNLGRAYDAAGKYKKAVEFYRKAADMDFVPAVNNLGVMYINGQGMKQNFQKGVDLLKQAFARGNKHARVAMQTTDFSVLFEEKEFASVQSALATQGDYASTIDGKFGAGSKAALKAYQARKKLARKGLTLETLDALGLVNVIPSYTLD